MKILQPIVNQTPLPPARTLGTRLMTAIDVMSVSSPMQIPGARADAMSFAAHYGFKMPAPADGIDSPSSFVRREGRSFAQHMRPIFDDELGRVAGSGQGYRLYLKEDLVHADIAAAASAGLVSPQIAVLMLDGVAGNAERVLEYSSSQIPGSRRLSPGFVAGRAASDIAVFGAAYAATGSAFAAAGLACAFALKIEGLSIVISRMLMRRERERIDARVAELSGIIERSREQRAPFYAAELRPGSQEFQELDEAELVFMD